MEEMIIQSRDVNSVLLGLNVNSCYLDVALFSILFNLRTES